MSRKGFTLIELLIVIAILGILVSLILPRFSDVREDANIKVCTANIRGLVQSMNVYEVKENVISSFTWGGTYDAAFLKNAGYLADVPKCPQGDGIADDNYTLSGDAGKAAVVCTINGAEHVWPKN